MFVTYVGGHPVRDRQTDGQTSSCSTVIWGYRSKTSVQCHIIKTVTDSAIKLMQDRRKINRQVVPKCANCYTDTVDIYGCR